MLKKTFFNKGFFFFMFLDKFFIPKIWERFVESLVICRVLSMALKSSRDLEIDIIFWERF